MTKSKTYLDYFLDNEFENDKKAKEKKKKKPKWDFNEKHEEAIVVFLSGKLSKEEQNELWRDIIYPSFFTIVNGVLQMRMFHFLPKNIDREMLIDDTILRLIENLNKFNPEKIGKSGKPVKAFSFLSTVSKHFILEKIIKAKKILDNKADIETSIDLQILSEEVLERMSGSLSTQETNEDSFDSLRKKIIRKIETIIFAQKNLETDFVKVGFILIHIFKNWNKIEIDKKNNFMRILVLYSGLKQTVVSNIFKNYKTLLLKDGLDELMIISPKTKSKKILFKEEGEEGEERKERATKKNKDKLYNFSTFEQFEAL